MIYNNYNTKPTGTKAAIKGLRVPVLSLMRKTGNPTQVTGLITQDARQEIALCLIAIPIITQMNKK